MNWRTQHLCDAFRAPFRSMRRAIGLGVLGLSLTGCGGTPSEPSDPATSRMSRTQLSVYGDNLMIQGRKLRDEGLASGDDVMKHRGEAMIARGQQLIDRTSAMPDEGEQKAPVPGITHSPY